MPSVTGGVQDLTSLHSTIATIRLNAFCHKHNRDSPRSNTHAQHTTVKMTDKNGLRELKRFITTHNAEGKAVVDTSIGEVTPAAPIGQGEVVFSLPYVTEQFPVDMNNDKDLNNYKKYLSSAPGLVNNTGTVVRIVDVGPDSLSPMHRTVSLDLGIVLEGELELVLDSGETRLMGPGDQCIQRGTMHAWRNVSKTKWGRMLYVLQPSQPLEVAGQKLGEDLADMKGVPKST